MSDQNNDKPKLPVPLDPATLKRFRQLQEMIREAKALVASDQKK